MILEERVIAAQHDSVERNELIRDYRNFIAACASRAVNRSITAEDDEFSVAMIAFDEAVTKYRDGRGSFTAFANIVIRRRLIDEFRRSKNPEIPMSSMSKTDDDGNEEDVDFEDINNPFSDTQHEIHSIENELKLFDISFFELPKVTPKSRKTKRLCFDAISYITGDNDLSECVIKKHILPMKELCDGTGINRKTIERHRKYIVAAVVIIKNDYPNIAQYFSMEKGW